MNSQNIEESFDNFLLSSNLKEILSAFNQLCDLADLNPSENSSSFYSTLQNKLKYYWKAQALFSKLEKKVSQKEYRQTGCSNINALVIGSGPCGLRTAIELALLGARVVVIEKRDCFSRNNVLHLWPYVIEDLKSLGAKIFFGMFCAGSIDHISIRRLQCILLKVALLFGVQFFVGVTFHSLIEPCKVGVQVSAKGDSANKCGVKDDDSGWCARVSPDDHIVANYHFNTIIGADGKTNILGFPRKELRCRLAIAITANFVNKNTFEEAQVEEISGVAFIFNQQFFKDIYKKTGIDLENIVYYKDETHYYVMTAKKHSLLAKGVIKNDSEDPELLLSPNNIDYNALQSYAKEAANVVTNYKIPNLEFSKNHRGEPDVAVFDFTHMFAAENASRIVERNGFMLLEVLVGDGLLEPFWPTGSGCALGFLSSLDASWLVRRLGLINNAMEQNKISNYEHKLAILEAIAERESVYQRLSQTTSSNMPPNFHTYSLNPRTRYTQCKMNCIDISQILHLYDTDDVSKKLNVHKTDYTNIPRNEFRSKSNQMATANSPKLMGINLLPNFESSITEKYMSCSTMKGEYMLRWFQIRLDRYFDCKKFKVDDLSKSWVNGVAFLCLIHLYRPDLIDLATITNEDKNKNIKTAISLFTNEFNVKDSSDIYESFINLDLIAIFIYLEKIYETLRALNPIRSEIYEHRSIDNRKVKRRSIPRNISKRYQMYEPTSSKEICKNADKQFESNDIEKGITESRKKEILKLYNSSNLGSSFKRNSFKRKDTVDSINQKYTHAISKEIKHKAGDKNPVKMFERFKMISSICHFCKTKVLAKMLKTFGSYSFHKYCFRCQYCNEDLTNHKFRILTDSRESEGKFYCMRHFEKFSNICFIRDKNVSNSLRDLELKEDKKVQKISKSETIQKIRKPRYSLADYGRLLTDGDDHSLPVNQIVKESSLLRETDLNTYVEKNFLSLRRVNNESDEEYDGSLDESNNTVLLLDVVEPLDESQFSWCLSFDRRDLEYAFKKCQVIRKNRLIYKKYKSKEESTSDESEINMLVDDICKTSDEDILDNCMVFNETSAEENLKNNCNIPKILPLPNNCHNDNLNSLDDIVQLQNNVTENVSNVESEALKNETIENFENNKNSFEISIINKIDNEKENSKTLRQLAKLKFCTEPPKPVSINPKEFISQINRKKMIIHNIQCVLESSENLPPVNDIFLTVSNQFAEIDNVITDKKSVLSASVLSLNDYGCKYKVKKLEFNNKINSTNKNISLINDCCYQEKYNNLISKNKPLTNLPPQSNFNDFCDIKDIDSLSVNTEDSSVTHTEMISENDIINLSVPLKFKTNQKATLDSELDISLGMSSISEIPIHKYSSNSIDSIETSSLNSSMKSDISASSESDGRCRMDEKLPSKTLFHKKIIDNSLCNPKRFRKNICHSEKNAKSNKRLLNGSGINQSTDFKDFSQMEDSFKFSNTVVTPPHDIELDYTGPQCMEMDSNYPSTIENSIVLKNVDSISTFQRINQINKQLENIEDRLNDFKQINNFEAAATDISYKNEISDILPFDEKSEINQLFQTSSDYNKDNSEEISKRVIMSLAL